MSSYDLEKPRDQPWGDAIPCHMQDWLIAYEIDENHPTERAQFQAMRSGIEELFTLRSYYAHHDMDSDMGFLIVNPGYGKKLLDFVYNMLDEIRAGHILDEEIYRAEMNDEAGMWWSEASILERIDVLAMGECRLSMAFDGGPPILPIKVMEDLLQLNEY